MSTIRTTYDDPALAGKAIAHDQARALLGQVMGLVAVTVGFAALGAYLGRDLRGATGLVLFIGAFALIFGLNSAAARAASSSRSDSCSVWAWCSDSRSPPSSPTTPRPTPPLFGRRPEPRRRSSLPLARTATPRAETSRRGDARCSGRCWP
jgi:hypothetical protein